MKIQPWPILLGVALVGLAYLLVVMLGGCARQQPRELATVAAPATKKPDYAGQVPWPEVPKVPWYLGAPMPGTNIVTTRVGRNSYSTGTLNGRPYRAQTVTYSGPGYRTTQGWANLGNGVTIRYQGSGGR